MPQMIQLELFDMTTFNILKEFKTALNEAAKKCGMSREEIVDAMSRLATSYGVSLVNGNGKRLTLDTLEKWLNPEALSRQMPIRVLPLFCAVVKDYEPYNILAKPLKLEIIGAEDQRLLEWARLKIRQKQDNRILRKLETEID